MIIVISNVIFSSAIHGLMYVSDSIFTGIKVASPIMVLICLLKVESLRARIFHLCLTLNYLLLVGGAIFLFAMIANTVSIFQSGSEEEKGFIISALTGAHWYQIAIPVLIFGIIPNLLWFKQIRKSIFSSIAIVIIWLIVFFVLMSPGTQFRANKVFAYGFFGFSFPEFIQKFGVFVALFFVAFFILKRMSNDADVK